MTKTKKEKTPTAMDNLLDNEDFSLPKVGDLVQGKILSIGKEVYVDINGVVTGLVRGRELIDESGEFSNINLGDEVTATVIDLENEKGVLELSFRSAGHQKAWQNLEDLKKQGKDIEVKVVDANKGGLMVAYKNMAGFMPVSQLNKEHYPRVDGGNKNKILEKLKSLVGEKIKAKIIDTNEKEEKIIFSEKEVYAKNKKEELSKFNVGDVIDGKVTGIVDFGVFVEFGKGLEGLIHISELAWQRVEHPKDLFSVGDKIKAQIIGIENERVTLSVKKLIEDPWKKAVEKYKVGQTVNGKVIKSDNFGAFVELDEDIHGLVHISELSDKKVENPEKIIEIGKNYDFKILSIEPEEHRLGLSLKNANNTEKENSADNQVAEPQETKKNNKDKDTEKNSEKE